MKRAAILIALICFVVAAALVGACARHDLRSNGKASISLRVTPEESKTQPKTVTLLKDSQSDKYGEVPFNHENHAMKLYGVDGKSAIACTECHHTDQPASALKPPLKTSERDAVLTAALLESADSKGGVKKCRTCHLQAGDDSKPIPTVAYPDNPSPKKMTNENAFHINCNFCHDEAITARPALKAKKVPGSDDCFPCHEPVK